MIILLIKGFLLYLMKLKFILPITFLLIASGVVVYKYATKSDYEVNDFEGTKIDSLNGVYVYYNGSVGNVYGRHLTSDGYNLGLKYQCVEFVKRYYYEYLNHKMPDSYGHAKDFFNKSVNDGSINQERNLLQFTNPSVTKPNVNDLIIFDATPFNDYGHVAIISAVTSNTIEIIQQNPGPQSPSRLSISYTLQDGLYRINDGKILGWLRLSL